jgi:hypothetical protein
MPRSPAKSLTSTAASPRTRASIHRVTLRRFGHGVMGPGRLANGPGGPTRDGRAAARRFHRISLETTMASLKPPSWRVHSEVGNELRFPLPVQLAGTGSQGSAARARVMASSAVSPWLAAESR